MAHANWEAKNKHGPEDQGSVRPPQMPRNQLSTEYSCILFVPDLISSVVLQRDNIIGSVVDFSFNYLIIK